MTAEEAIIALKKQQAHDRLKNDYCLLNNYSLLRLTAKHLPNLKFYIIDFIKSYSDLF